MSTEGAGAAASLGASIGAVGFSATTEEPTKSSIRIDSFSSGSDDFFAVDGLRVALNAIDDAHAGTHIRLSQGNSLNLNIRRSVYLGSSDYYTTSSPLCQRGDAPMFAVLRTVRIIIGSKLSVEVT